MPEGRVRRARRGDLPGLLALESLFPTDRLNRASFRHLLTRGHADVLVYARGAEVLGNAVVLYRRGSHRARLYSLVTHPAHRGQGIGQQLLTAAERVARRRGCEQIHLEVRPTNHTAIRLYQKRRYEIERRVVRFYEDGTDALRLAKPLVLRHAIAKGRS
jgi:ribosomal protein S18 acetylase RimI-like enzyme